MRDGWAVCDAAISVANAASRGMIPLSEIPASDYAIATLAAHLDTVETAERRRQMDEAARAFNGTSRRHR